MKRLITLLFAILFILSTSVSVCATDTTINSNSSQVEYRISSIPVYDSIDTQAAQHLGQIKPFIQADPASFGLSSAEAIGLTLGSRFTIYNYSKEGVQEGITQAYPITYQNRIVGIIEAYYNPSSMNYEFTSGRSYGFELNDALAELRQNNGSEFIVGRIADKLFVLCDNQIEVVHEYRDENNSALTDSISITDLRAIGKSIDIPNNAVYTNVLSSNNTTNDNSTSNVSIASNVGRAVPYISIPYVPQTGTCGIAGWAAILNYRFGTTYTNDSLATAMADNYATGSSGIPTMSDYARYANDVHNGGCSWATSLSFSTMKSKINNNRPIMGSWYRIASSSSKIYHAIIIVGYTQNSTSEYIYFLRNVSHSYVQMITVTNASSVVYVDGSNTWYLSQVVY